MTETSNSTIRSKRAPKPVGAYPHARKVGSLLFLSGIGPREPETDRIPGLKLNQDGEVLSYDIEAEVQSMFRNIRTILEDAGVRWENLIDVTIFLTDMKRDFATFNRIYSEHFTENLPCRTTVEVGALPTPIHIEAKCIATIE